jgi:NAD(P)-dependent dehydrogenase (short-subunit alcohol dehydrogenase family)
LGLNDTAIAHQPAFAVQSAFVTNQETRARTDERKVALAAIVHFLGSPEARYITGQAIHVNGGAFLN